MEEAMRSAVSQLRGVSHVRQIGLDRPLNRLSQISPLNRIVWRIVAVSVLLAFAANLAVAAPAPSRSYVCFAQFEALNESAHTATFKAQIADHVAKYAKRFKPGDHLVLVWDMIRKMQADTVLAMWSADELKSPALRSGYIVPIEFVAADAEGRTVTFTAHVPDKAISTLKSTRPEQWLKLTVPMDQPTDQAVITAIEISEKPKPAEASQTTSSEPGKSQAPGTAQASEKR
jgi:hypothetical protein